MSPRHYARQILQMTDIEERREALKNVPQDWRALIEKHLLIAWFHPNGGKKNG